MEQLAPAGPVYQAGTLSGNPLAMAAGLATLRHLKRHWKVYELLETRAQALEEGIAAIIRKKTLPMSVNRVGSMMTLFFHPGPVRCWQDANECNRAAFGQYHRAMIEAGVYMPPSQFEAFFVSSAHKQDDIEKTLKAMEASL